MPFTLFSFKGMWAYTPFLATLLKPLFALRLFDYWVSSVKKYRLAPGSVMITISLHFTSQSDCSLFSEQWEFHVRSCAVGIIVKSDSTSWYTYTWFLWQSELYSLNAKWNWSIIKQSEIDSGSLYNRHAFKWNKVSSWFSIINFSAKIDNFY